MAAIGGTLMLAIDLSGKNAIVTGAGRGLGAAMAKKLTQCGAQVIIVDIHDEEKIKGTLDDIGSVGSYPVYYSYDISEEENCKALIKRAEEEFGHIDILVNNAAISKQDWIQVFKVNTLAHYFLNTEVAEVMKKNGGGKIVNITTSGTFSGGGDGVKYNATKGGADSLTRFLAKQYAPYGININAVAPGPVLTDLMKGYWGEDVFTDHYLKQMPLKKLLVPDNIANVVLFLCSDLADAICGESILADGGRVRLCP